MTAAVQMDKLLQGHLIGDTLPPPHHQRNSGLRPGGNYRQNVIDGVVVRDRFEPDGTTLIRTPWLVQLHIHVYRKVTATER